MNDALIVVLAACAGVLLGAVFFGGLHWTVQHGLASERPVLWFVAGGGLRLGIALGGFYLVADGQWPRLVACLVGFIIARFLVIRFTRRAPPHRHAS